MSDEMIQGIMNTKQVFKSCNALNKKDIVMKKLK